MTKIGLIGGGYWGKNYVRTIEKIKGLELSWIYNKHNEPSYAIPKDSKFTKNYQDILEDNETKAVIISTPERTHYKIAKEALEAGKDVLVEKSMTCSSKDALELIEISKKNSRILMVGHIFLYNPGIIELKKRIVEPLGNLKRHFTGLSSKNGIPDTKNSEGYREWYWNRKKQILAVIKKYNFYEFYGNKSADTLLIAYGITSRVVSELKDEFAIFRPIRLFPILDELKEAAKNYEKIVVIEMNDGQYRGEVEGFLKRDVECISLLGGKISIEEVKDELKKIC